MTATKYLDLDGLARFKTKCDATYRTEAQVQGQINDAFRDYKQDVIEIKTSVPTVSNAQPGIIYLVIDDDASTPDIYTAYALENVDVSGTPTPTIVQLGTGRYTPALDDTPTDGSNHSVKSGGVYSALGDKVNTSDVTDTVAENDTKIPTGDAVYDFVTETFSNTIDTITNPEIDVLFINSDEIWIDSEWTAMDVLTTSGGTATALTKNSYGYFAFDPSTLVSADTLVFTDTAGTATTAYTGISQLSDITALQGKIISVADGDEEPNVLA